MLPLENIIENFISLPTELHAKNFYGGNGEIRTHGGLSTLDGFQDRSIKPLCHISRIGYQFI